MVELIAVYPWLDFGSEAPPPPTRRPRRRERHAPPREYGYRLHRLLWASGGPAR